jgi:hypothetical protein
MPGRVQGKTAFITGVTEAPHAGFRRLTIGQARHGAGTTQS